MIKILAKYTDINVYMKQGIPDKYESQKQPINVMIDCFYRFFSKKNNHHFRRLLLYLVSHSKIKTETDNFTLVTETRVW
jgi:hypothetical protein